MQIRVRVSELNFTVAVSGKGSPFNVTDSRAMARVEVASLINFGCFRFAARTEMALPQKSKTREKTTDVTVFLWKEGGPLGVMDKLSNNWFLPENARPKSKM
jgi:hypothetical protein